MLKEKWETVKKHLSDHREAYIIGGVCIVTAGITCAVTRGRHAGIQRVPDGQETVTVRSLSLLSGNTNNIVNVVEREGRGHTGYIVRCIETGDVFISQKEAAIAMDTYPSIVSGHLTGKLPDVNGNHLERLREIA